MVLADVRKPDEYLKMATEEALAAELAPAFAGFPFSGVPGYQCEDTEAFLETCVNVSQFGAGRIVTFSAPARPRAPLWQQRAVHTDYECAFVIRLILWASAGSKESIMLWLRHCSESLPSMPPKKPWTLNTRLLPWRRM